MTNSLNYLDQVDEIFVLENGNLLKKATPSNLDLIQYFDANINTHQVKKKSNRIIFSFSLFYIFY